MTRAGAHVDARDGPSVSASKGSSGASASAAPLRRRLVRDDRRAELIAAAIAVLRSEMDGGNWVAEVTRTAGAAKGTFYVYFSSWEDMLAVVRQRLIEDCNSPIRQALASPNQVDWWAVLEDQCVRFVDVVNEFARHHALIFHSVLPHDPGRESPSSTALLAAALERGVADGCFAPVDVDIAAPMLYAVVHAAADAVLAGGERERWIEACTALAHRYLARPTQGIRATRPSDDGTPPA